jgi:hypothetical protein
MTRLARWIATAIFIGAMIGTPVLTSYNPPRSLITWHELWERIQQHVDGNAYSDGWFWWASRNR